MRRVHTLLECPPVGPIAGVPLSAIGGTLPKTFGRIVDGTVRGVAHMNPEHFHRGDRSGGGDGPRSLLS